MTSVKSIDKTLKEYGRGIAGGLLFSLPMLYTMELWRTGFLTPPLNLLVYLIVGIFLLMIYNHYVGLSSDHNFLSCLMESLEELGLGIVVSVAILYLTGRIVPDVPYSETIGKIVVESVTVAIGISIGKSQLGTNTDSQDGEEKEESLPDSLNLDQRQRNFLRSINLALCGSLVIAANIAPTDEVVVIALETAPFKLLLISCISMAIGAAILYRINFKGAKKMMFHRESFMEIAAGTAIMYALALTVSAFMLWFFGRFSDLHLYGIIAETIVLGFPATLGASAGKLLIQ